MLLMLSTQVCDMLVHHSHIRVACRDYCHGLLQAGLQMKVALQHDHFSAAPANIGKIEEEFQANVVMQHTRLTEANLAKLRGLDTRFVPRFFCVLIGANPSTKLPPACISKPVLKRFCSARIDFLGNQFLELGYNACVCDGGKKINWGRCGFFELKFVRSENCITEVRFRYNPTMIVACKDECIDEAFDLEQGWGLSAVFKKGSRHHIVLEFFQAAQKKVIAASVWSGKEKEVDDHVLLAEQSLKKDMKTPEKSITKEQLMSETTKKRADALLAAKGKIQEAKEQAAKKRRVSLGQASTEVD